MARRRPDRVSIVAGVAVTLLGTLLLLDQADAIHLRFAYTAPAVLAAVGAVLLALGLGGPPSSDGAARTGATEDRAP